ncbi:MAG: elongation factor G [Firmicutes bacterium]|nr:elongation factor G [Bacillota bacterium]
MDIGKIRNVALIGHGGEGKTSLAEAMLFLVKATDRQGKVQDGNTVMDFEPEEIARKASISLAVANFEWEGVKINLIDVPGFFDFEGEMIQALSVADGAIVVMGSNGSISVGTEKALDYCRKINKPVMIFVNQMDKETANFGAAVAALKNKYGAKIAPIQIPIVQDQKMTGYVSLMSGKAYKLDDKGGRAEMPVPDGVKALCDEYMAGLSETAADNDDALMDKYLMEEPLTNEEIVGGINAGVKHAKAIPVLAGSAFAAKGIDNLLNQIVRLLPDPGGLAVTAREGDKEIKINAAAPQFCAQIFKTIADPFVGKLSYFRIFSGKVTAGSTIYNVNADKQEKVASLYTSKGKKQENAESLSAGDIGAFAKLQYTRTGNTLTDGAKYILPEIIFPEPVYQMAVSSAKQGEEDKVFGGLAKLLEEDCTLRISKNVSTAETLLSGLGETHLDVILKKLKNKFGVEAQMSTPKIPYRETVRKKAEAQGKHKKQSGGHGQYGDVHIRFEPYPDGDFLFAEEVVGGVVPRNFIPAVEKGLNECISRGVLAGYPVVNLKATLFFGSYHDVDSSEMAFKIAASLSFKKGCMEASPTILEPIYSYKIAVPDSYLGDIMGDMSKRRGRILGTAQGEGGQVIDAEAPLAEMYKYATDLRSMTQGRGSFTCAYERYEEVPGNLVPGIVEASPFKRKDEEE